MIAKTLRVTGLGLVLALLLAAAMTAQAGAAKNVNKESTKQVCEEAGGIFTEGTDADGVAIYSCDFGLGDVLVCDDLLSDLGGTQGCWWSAEQATADDGPVRPRHATITPAIAGTTIAPVDSPTCPASKSTPRIGERGTDCASGVKMTRTR